MPTDPHAHAHAHGDWDDALTRLEDVLSGLPANRALPDIDDLMALAQVDEEFLSSDDRAAKVVHEAIMARPLGSLAWIERISNEVELLTMEVEVLSQRLDRPDLGDDDRDATRRRLHDVHARLDGIRALL